MCRADNNMRVLAVSCVILISLIHSSVTGYQEQEIPRCYMTNEEYTTCGSACPPTCESRLASESIGCIAVCVPGCFCKSGTVRNRWGNCIPEERCPCNRPNERYTCDSCEATCDNLNQDCPPKHTKCNVACYCRAGYARDSNGVCISIYDCPGYSS